MRDLCIALDLNWYLTMLAEIWAISARNTSHAWELSSSLLNVSSLLAPHGTIVYTLYVKGSL